MIPLVEPDMTELEANAAYQVVLSGWINEGSLSNEMAEKFAAIVGSKFAVPTTSCTGALALSLMALGIKDREVIIPDITMIGTAMAVVQSGNTPVVVDVRLDDSCIDPEKVLEAVNSRTGAIIPVHVNGRNAVGPELIKIAQDHGLEIVEDAACCLGSTEQREGGPRQLGTIGISGCFSLAATKIVTSGQGGIIVTDDEEFYEKATRLKDWGRFEEKGTSHSQPGFNFKYTDIQAAITLKQLERLPELVARKQQIYDRYRQRLGGMMYSQEDAQGFCPWYVDINGQELKAKLREKAIGSDRIWPALHQQPAMDMAGRDHEFPVSTQLAGEILWLPSSTKLEDSQIDFICDVILE
jgi:perosamine synthetase